MRLAALFVVLAAALFFSQNTPSVQTHDSAAAHLQGSASASLNASAADATRDAPPCVPSDRYRLIATMMVDHPNLPSMAVVTDDVLPMKVISTGGSLGSRRVARIDRDRVELSGDECVLRRVAVAAADPVTEPAPSPAIRAVGKGDFRVSRAQVKEYLEDFKKISRDIRTRVRRRGDALQIQITRIRPGSAFAKLGLRSGDVLAGIDGESIQSPNDGLRLLDQVLRAGTAQVELKRRGRPVSFTVALAD